MIKTIIFIVILILIVAIPFAVLSNWGLGAIETYVKGSADKNWSADWQFKIAQIYSWTLRDEKAIKSYTAFIETYPSDTRYPDAKFNRAVCYSKTNDKDRAAAEFDEFAAWYPQHPKSSEAIKQAALIRYTH